MSGLRGLNGRVRGYVAPKLRHGKHTVVMTPPSVRVGNLLYFWLRCHARTALGHPTAALWTPSSEPWSRLWSLRERGLVRERGSVRPWDRREDLPPRYHQVFGTDFDRGQLDAFVREVLLSGAFAAQVSDRDDELTLNVRRGDYYDNDEYLPRYGFDLQGFLHEAVDLALADGVPTRVCVVSDDPDWCRQELAWLGEVAPLDVRPGGDPVADLARLASSSRLVLSNSTFSYWGGYLAQARRPDASVIAPAFHVRDIDDGRAWQLDDRWRVVEGHF